MAKNITTTIGPIGSYLMTDSSGNLTWGKQEEMIEFVEFALEIMGINLKYSDFENMSVADRTAFIRDLKIDKIID